MSREPRGLATSVLEQWLRSEHPELVADSELDATLIMGGRSNLTYRVLGGTSPLVLRRPPLGHVLASAHDMAREFRVISALGGSTVPVPEALLYRDDTDGTAGVGTPFYLMGLVEGQVLSSPAANVPFSPTQLRTLSLDLVATLAELHSIDPASVGLEDFGRASGYLERQVRRWGEQYDKSRSRELPELDALQASLREKVPSTIGSSLVHGDFRLDNAIVQVDSGGRPRIAAILDWEMATIGDSFTDLGLLGLYWDISSISEQAAAVAASAVDPAAGYPSFAELLDAYAAARGTAVPELSWYLAFAAYKLAIILEGIHLRFQAGETVGSGFDTIGGLVTPLARAGLRSLAERNP
ncbi:phosphotransferase family protein [Frigoribacterium sp. UYMn621]|jgi:aminoglycoside phosphotransferase (APT) family kinase protein|uniref:phosphotransferase family protein n=1 Tax=Frigoribacterium sp. UYMn621 TaxID=3156343 RepID=UPI0033957157